MSKAFYRWYAGVQDSIRQEVVERPTYGRSLGGSTRADTVQFQQEKAMKQAARKQTKAIQKQKSSQEQGR